MISRKKINRAKDGTHKKMLCHPLCSGEAETEINIKRGILFEFRFE